MDFIKKIVAYIKGLFGTGHTVDTAIASITDAIAKLDLVAKAHEIEHDLLDKVIAEKEDAKAFIAKEIKRAEKIAGNIKKLLD
jgi:hypothetical protein